MSVWWIASGKGVWREPAPAQGGPDPQPSEGEQVGEFNTPEQAYHAVACVNLCRDIAEGNFKVGKCENEDVLGRNLFAQAQFAAAALQRMSP